MNTPEAALPLPLKGATPAAGQSPIRGVCLAIALLSASLLGGCAVPEPWVKPYERERLADPIMKGSADPLSARHREHVLVVREGARGANSAQGGGCGCN